MKRFLYPAFLAGLLFASHFVLAQEARHGENLLPEGAFETLDANGKPSGWEFITPEGITSGGEAGSRWVRITNADNSRAVSLQKSVKLPPQTKVVVVSARMKTTNFALGKEGWHEARIALRFEDDAGKQAGGYPGMPNLRANSDWITREVVLEVPADATRLVLQPGLWLATGILEMDDIKVIPFASGGDLWRSRSVPVRVGFPEGKFEQTDQNGAPVGWTIPGQQVQVADVGGNKVLRISNATPDAEIAATGIFQVDPQWANLGIKLRARMSDYQAGTYGWKQGRILAQFLDENGGQLSEAALASISANADWKEYGTEQAVPANARYLRLSAGLERAAGVLEVDDIALTPAAEVPLGNAELPANQKLNWGQEPVTAISATRGQVSLNGLWRFVPAEGPAAKDPTAGWGYIKVPGNWKNNDDVIARGQGRIWQNFNGDRVNQAWYERTIRIPESWDGRAMLLDFQRVSTDAEVFINGTSAGQIRWPGGTVDITAHVKAGQEANLRLRVIAVDDRAQVEVYMGYLQTEMKPATLDNKGIIGDVNLLSRPAGGYVHDVLMRPSTRQKNLTVDIELGGVAQSGNVALTAKMLDEKGQAEQTFTKTIPVQPGAMQKITASWEWPNPRLWDVGRPHKYTMQLDVKGAGLNDQYMQEFGFREFWIEGKKFFLNNSEFRLRPGVVQYGAKPSQRLAQGHNFAEIWPERNTRRGSRNNDDELIADAENVGMPISGNTIFMADFLGKGWETPGVQADYRRQMEMLVRRWRNKPSILMWGTSGNALGTSTGDSDPWTMGLPEVNDVQEQLVRRERAREAIAMHKEVDPTRPVFGHHSDNGDFVTSNMYLNFIPLQEREEWLSRWATHGRVPWMAVEFGPPLYSSLMRGRDGYDHQGHSEPFLSEWTAVYLGKEAYQLEPANYRTEVIRDRYKGRDVQREYEPHIRNNGGDRIVSESLSYSRLLDLFYTNTWRSWRTLGVSGGMVPWHHDNHPALKQVNGPSLAWIANAGGVPDQSDKDAPVFTAKDHSFRTGQAIEKQIVLINDHRAPQEYTVQWETNVGGKRLAGETKTGSLKVGEMLFLPLKMAAPPTAPGNKAEGRIKLTAKIGPDTHEDSFAFRVFAPQARARGTLMVFDPAGETSAMLQSLGYSVRPWQGIAPPGTVLVIGRKALSQKNPLPGNLEAFLRNGGRAIVFAQNADWTKYALGLRTAPHLARRVFRIEANHPVAQGLDDYDLSDWAGVSKLVEGYPHYPGYQWLHAYGWHWGNRGAVSSTPIEKPHRTSWRPILETEFDLAYTPLMEMEYGAGRLTFCTLDLEDHVALDPAAQRLGRQLMEYVRIAPIAPKVQKVIYLGDDAGAKTLDMLGVVYTKATAIDPAAGLIVVGANPSVGDAALRTYASSGGKLLFLRRTAAGALGNQMEQAKEFSGSLSVPAWPEARGLSASDLRWRSAGEAWLLKGGADVTVGADGQLGRVTIGKGVALFAQVGPDAVPADEKRYFRFTRWRQTRALAQILANMGASFTQDARILALLQQPQHAWMLAGTWDAQLTKAIPELPTRDLPSHHWNPDSGMTDLAKSLIAVNAPTTGWEKVIVPGYMESYGGKWRFSDGEAVFRKVVDIPAHLAGKDMFLSIGRIDETEETFFNGESVGKSRSWLFGRGHRIPGRLVKAGKNVIAVRTWDEGIHGGFNADPQHLYLRALGAPTGFYHDDYISDDIDETTDEKGWQARTERWKIADNPYRYYRW